MSFITNEFWIALYMQDVQHYTPIQIAARMLPQAVAGVFWSFLGQWLVQEVHGTIVMGIGSSMYLAGAILLLFIKEDTSYWLFLFPALVITVIGADFQFIVANVSFLSYLSFPTFSFTSLLFFFLLASTNSSLTKRSSMQISKCQPKHPSVSESSKQPTDSP